MYIHVEGNIGSGKSTLLSAIEAKYGIETKKENTDEWCNMIPGTDSNLLDKMYKDTKRWSFLFQTNVLHDFSYLDYQIMERSAASSINVFSKIALDNGNLSHLEYHVLLKINQLLPKKDIIYCFVNIDPVLCWNRMKKRSRPEEKDISLNYLKLVDDYYNKWVVDEQPNVIHFGSDLETNLDIFSRHFKLIDGKFIKI